MAETAEADTAQSELKRIERQIDKLVMAIADGADALPLNTKIKELGHHQSLLQGKIDSASDPEPLIHPSLAEVYRTRIESLHSVLNNPQCKTEAFDIIRTLIEEVRLTPENDKLSISLKGELAGILSLCDTKEKPAASYEERAEQIKVVAGAGFTQDPTNQTIMMTV